MQIIEARIGEPLEDYLERSYVTERRTDEEIARALGLNGSTIARWRATFGIAGRSFGPRAVAS